MLRILLMLSIAAATPTAAAQLPMTPPTMDAAVIEMAAPVTVPMRAFDGLRAGVHVMVNGRGPYLFAVETGGPYAVVVDVALADALQLPAPASGAAGRRVVERLSIGGLTIRSVAVGTRNGTGFPGVDGMLGLETFRDLTLTLDYPRREVRFDREPLPALNDQDVLPLVRKGPLVGFGATLAGTPGTLIVDSQGGLATAAGCAASIAETMPYVAPPVVTGQMRLGGVDSTPAPLYAGRLDGALRFGAIILQQPLISTMSLPPALGCIAGVELLQHFAVSIDLRNMRARFAGARTVEAPGPLYLAGVSFLPDPQGVLRAASVMPGGAAERAGLRANDEIVEVAGKPATFATVSPGLVRAMVATGAEMRVTYRRDGQLRDVVIIPVLAIR